MKKIIIKFICCFIPSKNKRHKLRNKYLKNNELLLNCCSLFNYENNNELIIYKENGEIIKNPTILPKGLKIEFLGSNSKIILHEPFTFENVIFKPKNNNYIEIKKNSYILYLETIHPMGDNNKLIIDEDITCVGCKIYLHDGNNNFIKIGKDCLFSFDIILWPHDGHPIYKKGTKEIINNPKDGMYIGDHVWIGRGANLLKNTYIDNDTVIGANSLVCKSFKGQTNIAIAGNPAKIVKENIDWEKTY